MRELGGGQFRFFNYPAFPSRKLTAVSMICASISLRFSSSGLLAQVEKCEDAAGEPERLRKLLDVLHLFARGTRKRLINN